MKSTYLSTFCFILFSMVVSAQIIVKGDLLIDKSSEACMYAKVYVTTTDSTQVINTMADSLGGFNFEIENKVGENSYLIFIKHPEVKDSMLTFSILLNVSEINLGKIYLTPIANLDEFVISNKKRIVEKKIDRLVFNIEGTSNEFGKTALQLLARTPLINVFNRTISMLGKESVEVMINNRFLYLDDEDLIQYLESIPSEDVMSIEVITNPPAKYDASGSALVNMVLKKNRILGFNGSVNSSYTQAFYDYERLSTSLNYRKNKFNLYGSLNGRVGNERYVSTADYFYENRLNEQRDITKVHAKGVGGSLGFDYFFSEKTTMSISADINGSNTKQKTDSKTKFTSFNELDSISLIDRLFLPYRKYYGVNANFLSELDSTGQTLTINVNYMSNISSSTNGYYAKNYVNDYLTSNYVLNSGTNQHIQIGVFGLDYTKPTSIGEFSFGGKFNWIGNQNGNFLERKINGVIENDLSQNDRFIYNEYNEALYVMYNKEWDNDELQIGMRGEYTQLIGKQINSSNTLKREFFAIFPELYYLHNFDNGNYLSFDMGRRIHRPGYSSLNPFRRYSTIFNYDIGNPALRPTYEAEANVDFGVGDIMGIGLKYTNFHNSYMLRPIKEDTHTIAFTEHNVGNTHQYGVNIDAYTSIGEKIDLSIYAAYFYSVFNSKIYDFAGSKAHILFFNLNTSIKITNGLTVDMMFTTRPLGSIYTLSNQGSQYILGGGLTQRLLNNQLVISCNVSDIFKMATPRIKMISNDFTIKSWDYYDTFDVSFSISYRFGNRFIKNKRNRETGAEEEINRM